jgi:hypothetical protein
VPATGCVENLGNYYTSMCYFPNIRESIIFHNFRLQLNRRIPVPIRLIILYSNSIRKIYENDQEVATV